MAGNLPFGLVPSGELTNYTPTLREKVADWLRQSLFTDDKAGQDQANRLTNWGETMLPPFGFATSMYDAGNQAGHGNYLGAGLTAGAAFIPGPEGKAAEKAGIRAFHGSPHSFDRFDMSKIGTGEGAQAYGHGLYFAENEGVAKGYRDALAPAPSAAQEAAQRALDQFGGNAEAAANHVSKFIEDNGSGMLPETVDHYWGVEKILRGNSAFPGHMYEVSINADPNSFLDWDKPLSEQPEAVRKALKNVNADSGGMSVKDRVDTIEAAMSGDPRLAHLLSDKSINVPGDVIHQKMFHATRKEAGGNQGASVYQEAVRKQLNEAGIPGIKYLDAGSRGTGDGTRNYVVFDDKLISIVRKYGIAGASAYLGYDIMQNVTPAQAEELKKIEGK